MSEKTKRKISRIMKKIMNTPEMRKKVSDSHLGISTLWKGGHHTEETKIKIGKGNTGKKCSEEKKRKISISNMGRIVSEETKQKLKIAAKYRPKDIRRNKTKNEIKNSLE